MTDVAGGAQVTADECLGPTDVMDCEHPAIRRTVEELTAHAADEVEAARALFDFVRDDIRYDMGPILSERADWTASRTLERGYGFCQQKAVLLATLLRCRGIAAGVGMEVVQDAKIPPRLAAHIGSQELDPHGYTTVRLAGQWQRVDASLDSGLCDRKGYRRVEFVPGADCLLPATDRAGHPHFEHVRRHGEWPDMPEDVVTATLELDYLRNPEFRQLATRHGPSI